MSYFAGGLRFHEQLYGVVGAQTHISLLGISIAAILLPEAFHLAWPDTAEGAATVTATTNRGSSQLAPAELKQVLAMSRGLSIILLVCYGVYLTFQLWTHAYLFKAVREPVSTLPPPHNPRVFPRPQWVPSLRTVMSRDTWDRSSSSSSSSRSRSPSPRGRPVVRITERSGSDSTTSSRDRDRARARATPRPTRVHDFGLPSPILNPAAQHAPTPLRLDEKGVAAAAAAAAAATAVPPLSPSPVPVPIVPVTPGMLAHDVERGIRYHPRREVAHALPKTSALFAMIALFAFTGLAGITAECLVDSIDGMTEHTNISREFIGMILLPVIGNSVEHITAVTVSLKDRLNLSLSIAVGSSIQVSLCLIPLLTLLGWAIGQPMSLLFDTYETICLIIAVLLVNFALTGRTNYLQGFTLMMAWVAMAVVTFFYDPAY
jgi:Ca2+:H+ antiporter